MVVAIGDAYATTAQYKAQTGKTTADDDTALTRDLLAVSRYIDRVTGRRLGFSQDGAAVARIYDSPSRGGGASGWEDMENPWKSGHVSRYLDIEDHVSISGITIDESLDNTFSLSLVAADYELLPRGATSLPEPRPYHQIRMTEWGAQGAWPAGARVKVTGIGGWPAVPSAIQVAAIELVALLRIESPRASTRYNEMNQVFGVSRAAQGIVAELQDAYRHPRSIL